MFKKECLSFTSLGDTLKGVLFLPNSSLPIDPSDDLNEEPLLPVVILCHGAIDYKEHFFEFAEFLAGHGYAALAIDMHGHGESEGARYHVRMSQWVPDINAAIDCLSSHKRIDPDRIGALGFSSGGSAILESAAQHSLLKAIVTIDATIRTVISPVEATFFKAASAVGRVKRKLTGQDLLIPLYSTAIKTPAACSAELNHSFYNDPYFVAGYQAYPLPGALESLIIDTLKRVDQIEIPVCVIHGQDDKVDSPESAQLLYDKLSSKKQLNIIPGSGHIGHMDNKKSEIQSISKQWFDEYL